MKKLIYLLLVIFATSCATGLKELNELKVIFPSEKLYGIDFTPFTKKNFLITPEKYTGNYESIGIINFTAKPGAKYIKLGFKANPDYTEQNNQLKYLESFDWKVDSIIFSDVLNKVYKICTDMGADALVNFKNDIIYDSHSDISNPVTIMGYEISGFAIKRKAE
jgi:hypothetical protein